MNPDPNTPEPTEPNEPNEPAESTEAAGQDRYRQLLAEAVTVLTAAARLTRPTLERDEEASNEAGHPVWVESSRREPIDWAEFVTLALAGAAANIGSIDAVLDGRPGSWEADGVRNLLTSTVGYEQEHLLAHRTEPIMVELYVDEILVDLGYWGQYDQAEQQIYHRYESAGLVHAYADPWVPQPLTAEQERISEELAELENGLDELRRRDWEQYGEALKAHVLAAAAARNDLPVPVKVRVDLDTYRSGGGQNYWHDSIENDLQAAAIKATPLPGDGRPPLPRLENPAHDERHAQDAATAPSALRAGGESGAGSSEADGPEGQG